MDADPADQTPARPRGRGRVLAVVLVAVVVLLAPALLIAACSMLLNSTACSAAERQAFTGFPHYGNVRLQPSGDGETGSCAGFYQVADSAERIVGYYERALVARGWAVQPLQRSAQGSEFQSGELRARRDGYTYAVLCESGPALEGGTHIAVHVSKD
jgi:hypothetical protein